jgi:hypothetical protein
MKKCQVVNSCTRKDRLLECILQGQNQWLEQNVAAYRPEIEQAMKKEYATLAEKDRRRYAAAEAMKLGAVEQKVSKK